MAEPKPILLVEDNPDDQVLIARACRKALLANPLQTVGDGDSAVAYLAGTDPFNDRAAYPLPVVILLDIKLPRRSGLEVLSWIHDHPPLNRIPVVMLTSSKDVSDVNRAYDLGANSYLVKPVDFDGLMHMVKNLGIYWTILNEPAPA
jgi:CheY-like chemotaxis protein